MNTLKFIFWSMVFTLLISIITPKILNSFAMQATKINPSATAHIISLPY